MNKKQELAFLQSSLTTPGERAPWGRWAPCCVCADSLLASHSHLCKDVCECWQRANAVAPAQREGRGHTMLKGAEWMEEGGRGSGSEEGTDALGGPSPDSAAAHRSPLVML